MAAKKFYDVKTKVKAIKMHEHGTAPKEICAKLNIRPPRLYAWLKKKVEIEDEYEDGMLKKYGDRGDLTLEQAEAIDSGESEAVTPDISRLLVENDMLRDELSRMRESVITLRAEKRVAQ